MTVASAGTDQHAARDQQIARAGFMHVQSAAFIRRRANSREALGHVLHIR